MISMVKFLLQSLVELGLAPPSSICCYVCQNMDVLYKVLFYAFFIIFK
jgi:hypothetical protein